MSVCSMSADVDTYLTVKMMDGRLGRHLLSGVDSVDYELNAIDENATAEHGTTVSGQIGGHYYVDLGLPSGTLWATLEVGSNSIYGSGFGVKWGATEQKQSIMWSGYDWCISDEKGNLVELTKYCDTIDQKRILDPEDDIASVVWGEDWRMPTPEELQELIDGCTWTASKKIIDGQNCCGIIGTSKYNKRTIYKYTGHYSVGSFKTWSNSLGDSNEEAVYASITQYDQSLKTAQRCITNPVRAVVASPEKAEGAIAMRVNSINNKVTNYDISNVDEVVVEDVNLYETGTVDGYAYVDLGLPSGLKWATYNVGASTRSDYGDYFAWGEVKQKSSHYDWDTYKWCEGTDRTLTKYITNPTFDLGSIGTYGKENDSLTILLPQDDAATQNWGEHWRMPTKEEVSELIENCTWVWTKNYEGTRVAGKIGTSKRNGAVIFFPASGWLWIDDEVEYVNSYDEYWTSEVTEFPNSAWCYSNDVEQILLKRSSRSMGLPVRAVTE